MVESDTGSVPEEGDQGVGEIIRRSRREIEHAVGRRDSELASCGNDLPL